SSTVFTPKLAWRQRRPVTAAACTSSATLDDFSRSRCTPRRPPNRRAQLAIGCCLPAGKSLVALPRNPEGSLLVPLVWALVPAGSTRVASLREGESRHRRRFAHASIIPLHPANLVRRIIEIMLTNASG